MTDYIPKPGDRVIIHMDGHAAESTTSWFDGVVVETFAITDGYSMKVLFVSKEFVKRIFRKPAKLIKTGWFSSSQLIAVIPNCKKEVDELEKMWKK